MADRSKKSRAVINRHVYVPHYLMITANGLVSGASRLYRKHFDLGINECRITAVLGHEPGKTASELSHAITMNKSIVSRSLHTLLERGIVQQSGPNRGGGYSLTAKGDHLHDAVVRISMHREALLLDGIDEGERALLLKLLARMLDNVTRMISDGPLEGTYEDVS